MSKPSPNKLLKSKKLTLDKTHEFQIIVLGKRIEHPDSNIEYRYFTQKTPFLEPIHTTLSFSTLFTNFPSNLQKKDSAISNSQSFRCLEKPGFQCPASPHSFQTSVSQASLFIVQAYRMGKTCKGSSPHHLSTKNQALLTSSTSKEILELIRSHPFLIAFQILIPCPPLTVQDLQFPSSPYPELPASKKHLLRRHISNFTFPKGPY